MVHKGSFIFGGFQFPVFRKIKKLGLAIPHTTEKIHLSICCAGNLAFNGMGLKAIYSISLFLPPAATGLTFHSSGQISNH
jgi:hypothetical protein